MPRTTPQVTNTLHVDRAIEAIDLIGDRWSVIVLHQLVVHSVLRFSELERHIGNISPSVLTRTLRSLERDGLVARKIYPTVPPRVEYELTPLARTLRDPISALCSWSKAHYGKVKVARKAYDKSQQANT